MVPFAVGLLIGVVIGVFLMSIVIVCTEDRGRRSK